MSRTLRCVFAALVIVIAARSGNGCGPDFPQAFYTSRIAPDPPIESYAAGKLGIVQPTYARRYLIVAYDVLSGRPLSAFEQATFSNINPAPDNQDLIVGYAHWQEARKLVLPDAVVSDTPDATRLLPGQQFQYYVNCLPDAYEIAARTLKTRIAAHKSETGNLQHWVSGQDIVFQNCKAGTAIPASLPNVPKWLQQDRAYQIASAHFYSEDFDSARLEYNAIAADPASPWATAANYLVARTDIRQAMLTPKPPDLARLKQAEQHLEKLLQTKRAGAYAESARGLLNYIRFRTQPDAQAVALAKEITGRNEDQRFAQDVTDLTRLFDRGTPNDDVRKQCELIDWVFTMQSTGKADMDHALERWRTTRKEQWLVAALTKSAPDGPASAELIDAAKLVPPSSPAFASVVFHRAVMLNAAHRSDEVRAALDDILPDARTSQPISTVNALLHERMLAADSLPDFFAHLVRRPANYGYGRQPLDPDIANNPAVLSSILCASEQDESNEERALRFDEGGAALLNQSMPLSQIIAGIDNEPMPSHLRFELSLAAWTRAAILGDSAVADHLISKLSACDPRLQPFLLEFRRAKSPEAQRFAAVYTLLHFPGLQPYVATNLARTTDLEKIDNYRRNWWCTDDASPQIKPSPPPFLTEQMLAQAKKEQAILQQASPAPKYLALESTAWAKANPKDPRSPEALALSIRATRFGCSGGNTGETGAASKAAFDLLHSQYPNSEWAKKYPYWFKD